jgi:leucyl aminopeptidase
MIRSIVRSPAKFTGKEEVVVVPLFEGDKHITGLTKKLDVLCRSAVTKAMQKGYFKAKNGEKLLLTQNLPKAPDHILLLGMGTRARADAETMASAAGAASRELKSRSFKTCYVLVGDDETLTNSAHAFLKGFLLAQYQYSLAAKKPPAGKLGKLVLLSDNNRGLAPAIRSARVVAEYSAHARDLVNTPADRMSPAQVAEVAKSLAKEFGFQCKVMGPKEIERQGMGAVMSVAKGSRYEPRFITLHYNKGKRGVPRVCLVGKGVTFDTGGISIKPWMNMNEMKGDMAGAALVISTIAAAAKMKVPLEIIALLPCVENMPDGLAFRPGDVVTTYTGKTIEVISTDAEGRLILADALAYGCEFEPDVIVDFATLTGAVVIALGTRIAGVMGTSQKHIDLLIDAGTRTGEPVWQLPLDDAFSESVRGDISDYKNYGGRDGSTITAAALLKEFVGKTPWLHVDIAGTFWSASGKVSYHSKGATGYGVDLTLSFLQSIAEG